MKKLILTITAAAAVLSVVGATLRADDTTSTSTGSDTQCRHQHDGGVQCSGSDSQINFGVQCSGSDSVLGFGPACSGSNSVQS